MKTIHFNQITAVLVSILVLGAAAGPAVADHGLGSNFEVSLMGGVQHLNENDTALPDHITNVPAVATVTYHVNSYLAAEGEFTWLIPIEQSVEVGPGESRDVKTPDVLAYQASLRASWPFSSASVAPYLAAGAGAVTFLSDTDPDRLPRLDESETAFAINFGGGVAYGLGEDWALRADFRELVAFPSDDAVGLSSDGTADEIWMERGTIGVAYRF